MGAQLNIKNAEAVALATELAKAEGLTKTEIILEALRTFERERARDTKIERALEICREAAKHLPDEQLSLTHGDLLYDDLGAPK